MPKQEKIYRVRLVCGGHQQRYGMDSFETYVPVIRLASLRTMLAIVLHKKMHIIQTEVKTAIVYGILEEDTFMEQEERCFTEQNYDYVCQPQKTIYGLKEAPRAWY